MGPKKERLCYNCFRERPEGEGPCPYCGFDLEENARDYPNALRAGTVLNDRYVVGRVLGQGGFGITYLAWDGKLQARVAVKEFMPNEIATRIGTTVSVAMKSKSEEFTYGAERFQEEARTLAKFMGQPNIAGVTDYFDENDTSYFVMDYIEGISFKTYIANHGGKVSVEEALNVMIPVLRALTAVHAEGFIHRDVTPDNIYITKDGVVKLLDFGSARYSIGDKSKSLDVILKVGYAPKEQYIRRSRQGPYTDVYSCAACFYAAITGYLPPESLERLDHDELQPVSALGIDIPEYLDKAILKGLAVQPEDRFQSAAEFLEAIESQQVVEVPAPAAPAAAPTPGGEKKFAILGGAAAAVAVLAICLSLLFGGGGENGGGGEEAPPLIQAPVPSITIRGEEYSTDLRTLELTDSGLTNEDIAPLENMVNLTTLYLPSDSKISDLSPLSGLTNLKKLRISGDNNNSSVNSISDFTPLAGLTGLEDLQIAGSSISDLSFLENLTNLTSLRLQGFLDIQDLSPLTNLTKLQRLWIRSGGNNGTFYLDDLSPLSSLTGLEELQLHAEGISSFAWASGMTELLRLECSGGEATYSDVDALAGLTKLQTLRLPIRSSGDNIAPYDIQGLAGLTELVSLDIPCGVKDLTPLENLTKLTYLSFHNGGNIQGSDKSLEPLRNLTNLTQLEFNVDMYDDAPRTIDISPLAGLTKLNVLVISARTSGSWDFTQPSISSLSALSGMTDLRTLTLNVTNVTDLSALRDLTQLQSLTFYNNGPNDVTDWSPVDHVASVTTN